NPTRPSWRPRYDRAPADAWFETNRGPRRIAHGGGTVDRIEVVAEPLPHIPAKIVNSETVRLRSAHRSGAFLHRLLQVFSRLRAGDTKMKAPRFLFTRFSFRRADPLGFGRQPVAGARHIALARRQV